MDIGTPALMGHPHCANDPSALSAIAATLTCISHGGLQRCWYTYAGATASNHSASALVIDLHGLMGCAEEMPRYSGWREQSDKHGFVVAWPQASQKLAVKSPRGTEQFSSWNAGRCCSNAAAGQVDDVGFLRKASRAIVATHSIDPTRIYFAGHSNGCMMAQTIALEVSDIVAAVCCHAGYLMNTPEDAATFLVRPPGYSPVSVMTIHGSDDKVVPWARAYSDGSIFPADDVWWPGAMHNLETWARLNGCKGSASADWNGEANKRYRLHAHTACANSTQVKIMEVPVAGHMPYRNRHMEIDTTAACWDFVSQFTRRRSTPHTLFAHAHTRAH